MQKKGAFFSILLVSVCFFTACSLPADLPMSEGKTSETACANSSRSESDSPTSLTGRTGSITTTWAPATTQFQPQTMASTHVSSPFAGKGVTVVQLLERDVKMSGNKPVSQEQFSVIRTLSGKQAVDALLATLNGEKWEPVSAESWAKFNPARANRYAMIFLCGNSRRIVLNLHFSSPTSHCYAAVSEYGGKIPYEAYVNREQSEEEFTRYILTKATGAYLLELFKP